MKWLIILVVVAVIGVVVAALVKRRHEAGKEDFAQEETPADIRGYRLVPGPKACGAALRKAASPVAPNEAGPLPLPDCASKRCQCRYEPLAGRRRGQRREKPDRREAVRFGEDKPDRRSGRDRRQSGLDPWGRGGD